MAFLRTFKDRSQLAEDAKRLSERAARVAAATPTAKFNALLASVTVIGLR